MNKKKIFFPVLVTGLLTFAVSVVRAQAGAPVHRLDTSLVAFMGGRWSGEGSFAGGRKIAADVSFRLSLDSCWLVYEHADRPPNGYKATSMWGVDGGTGEFVAYVFDNFHGHRQFVSNGWKEGKLLLSHQAITPQGVVYFEHFIYERLSGTQFKMTYETSLDGMSWQMGDWLVFTRKG